MADTHTLDLLVELIRSRKAEKGDKSYTRQLLAAGAERCARKFGEEALETVIAALGSDRTALKSEAADTLYHLLVLLECREVAFEDVLAELGNRMGVSGLEEKASRPKAKS